MYLCAAVFPFPRSRLKVWSRDELGSQLSRPASARTFFTLTYGTPPPRLFPKPIILGQWACTEKKA